MAISSENNIKALFSLVEKLNASSLLHSQEAGLKQFEAINEKIKKIVDDQSIILSSKGLEDIKGRIKALSNFVKLCKEKNLENDSESNQEIDIACIGILTRIQSVFSIVSPLPSQFKAWDKAAKDAIDNARNSNGFNINFFKQVIISKKINVHFAQYEGNTLLDLAFSLDNPELVDLLIKAGADVCSVSHRQDTRQKNVSSVMMRLLVKEFSPESDKKEQSAGQSLLSCLKTSETPIIKTEACNKKKIARQLIVAGASLNEIIMFRDQQTCLAMHLFSMPSDMIQFLIDEGLHINITLPDPYGVSDPTNNTPLIMALVGKKFNNASLLVYNGAILDFENHSGMRELWGERYKSYRTIYQGCVSQILKYLLDCLKESEELRKAGIPIELFSIIVDYYGNKGPVPSELAKRCTIEGTHVRHSRSLSCSKLVLNHRMSAPAALPSQTSVQ